MVESDFVPLEPHVASVDIPPTSFDDVLALPVRRRLFATVGALGRPATTQELARRVGRHPNNVRAHLERLAAAGLLERRTARQSRGRPRHEWAIAADAKPGGEAPQAYGDLAGWLARALARPSGPAGIEQLGREIGRELADGGPTGRPADEAMLDALAALGFAPRVERPSPGTFRFVLRNCPYRKAVRANQPAICALHRGVSRGLLEVLAPHWTLTAFAPRDPDAAGCLVETASGAG